MGVDYFNCSRCNSIECDCGDYVTCVCGACYCVNCRDELKLLFGENEDDSLNFCFECYNNKLNDKKIDDYDKKINKYKRLIKKHEDAKENYIIKYQKEHKIKGKDDTKEKQ